MWAKNKAGFTIVEILIVIVVIAILAAITIVAFNGVKARALESEKSSKLSNVYKSLINFKTLNGYYPSTASLGGDVGAKLIGLQLKDVEPSNATTPGNGIEPGFVGSGDYHIKYLTWPNADGSGFGGWCGRVEAPEPCQSFLLGYYDRLTNQAKTLQNPER